MKGPNKYMSRWMDLCFLGVTATSAWSCVKEVRNPMISLKDGADVRVPGSPEGTVHAVVVELADPSILDRLVAASTSMIIVLISVALMAGLRWLDHQDQDEAPKKLSRRTSFLIAFAGLFVVGAPFITQWGREHYFGGHVYFPPTEAAMTTLLLVVALFMAQFMGDRYNWVKDHERADVLDQQMKSVV